VNCTVYCGVWLQKQNQKAKIEKYMSLDVCGPGGGSLLKMWVTSAVAYAVSAKPQVTQKWLLNCHHAAAANSTHFYFNNLI